MSNIKLQEVAKVIPAELTVIDDLLEFENYNIQQESDLERIALVGQMASKRIKELDELRLSMTRPIKEGIRKIEEEFHRITDPLEHLKRTLAKKVGTYWDAVHKQKEIEAKAERERQLQEERRLLDEAATAALSTGSDLDILALETRTKVVEKLETVPVTVKQTVRTHGATMAQTRVWTYRITDESKIPREFLIVDTSKLQKYATAMKESGKVDGVEFFQESKASFAR